MNGIIVIDGWKAKIRFSAAHVIPEYEKCGRLHGHSYAIHARLHGKQDENGIIIDFSLAKQILRTIADQLDHKVLIPNKSKVVNIKKSDHSINLESLGKTYVFPESDCILLPISSSSAEHLAEYVLKSFLSKLQDNHMLTKIEIGVDEGYGQGAWILRTLK
ncbi:MAG: 6-pyruvoyl tetrahydropterin synthase family protein [Candidatus Thermoplasmatota archaeon]|nr:6-pyruvoyl tetrahydropterin synthase family protein [Candidatus Thermoplasmatota archaeon]